MRELLYVYLLQRTCDSAALFLLQESKWTLWSLSITISCPVQIRPSNIYFIISQPTKSTHHNSRQVSSQLRLRKQQLPSIVVSSTMNHITYQVTLYLNLSIKCFNELYNHINADNPIDQNKINDI